MARLHFLAFFLCLFPFALSSCGESEEDTLNDGTTITCLPTGRSYSTLEEEAESANRPLPPEFQDGSWSDYFESLSCCDSNDKKVEIVKPDPEDPQTCGPAPGCCAKVCLPCGNGVCDSDLEEEFESFCNCPDDCGKDAD